MGTDVSHRAFEAARRFGSLDGLRALSIAEVVWHHVAEGRPGYGPLLGGLRGVDVFMAISGFLITTILLREHERQKTGFFRRFYVNRALRTFPLYYTVLGLYVLLVATLQAGEPTSRQFFGNLPYFLTYTSNYYVGPAPGVTFSFAWSLAALVQFYLAWPLVVRFLPTRLAVGGVGSLCALAAASQYGWLGPYVEPRTWWVVALGRLPLTLFMASLLAYAAHFRASFHWMNEVIGRWSCLVIVGLLGLTLQAETPAVLTQGLIALLVVSCALREDHILAPFLTLPLLARVGTVGLGAYLLHGLVYNVVQRVEPSLLHGFRAPWIDFVIVLTATLALADLSYRYYESRFTRFKMASATVART